MNTCRECKERLYPDDPRVKSGKYMRCSCDYCNKPDYYREVEKPAPESQLPKPEWTGRQWDKVQQLQSEVEGWRQKHSETMLALDKLTKKIKLYEGGDLT